jgi:FKBP-type peptidyl-prolyl cis-trans isomerase
VLALVITSCGNSKNKKNPNASSEQNNLKESLIEANKTRIEIENSQIEGYIKRRGWNMIKTGTGLRYMIYENGSGKKAVKDSRATVDFDIELIDGTKCYDTKSKGPKEFLVGMDHIESGIHEGILYMKEGDKAKMILPSHLAHGLIGDMDKIPAKSTIIYDIHLISIR